MIKKLINWLPKLKKVTPESKVETNINALVTYLTEKIKNEKFSKTFSHRVNKFKKLNRHEKEKQVAGIYLLGEQYLLRQKEIDNKNLKFFREKIVSNFPLVTSIPEFHLVFQTREVQEKLLSYHFLKNVLDNILKILGHAKGKYFDETLREITKLKDATDNRNAPQINKALKTLSREVFNKVSDITGDQSASRIFQHAYEFLINNYKLLDTFPHIIDLLPEQSLNAEQLEILNKSQIQDILIQKVNTLQDINERLQHEIDERRRVELELKESESLLNEIIESAMDAVVLMNERGNVLYWSHRAERLFGWKSKEILDKKLIEYIIPERFRSRYNQELQDYLSGDQQKALHRRIETPGLHKSGEEIDIELSVTSVKVKGEYIFSSFIRDIRRRKKYQDDIIKAKEQAEKASEAKLDFLSMMSHEIRTPLNAVIGTTQLLLSADPRKDQLDNLNILKFSAENLLVIINDILDFNKIEEGMIDFAEKPFSLFKLCSNIVASFMPTGQEKDLYMRMEGDIPQDLIVTGDQTRLSQILINLIGNAIKFTDTGGVTLNATVLDASNSHVSLRFKVKDTGIGIAADKLEQIFDRFTQVHDLSSKKKYGGTGLGLAITKRLLQLMGSNLHVESKLGEGTNFYFDLTIPFSQKQVEHSSLQDSRDFSRIRNKRILIVEDYQINQVVATKFLNKYMCEVDIAENGLVAIEMFQKNKYDLILMDIEMPEMNGYDAATRIREIEKNKGDRLQTPIIALTANALMDVQGKVQNSGMNDFIPKPFDADFFYSKIATYIL